jgi:uncharacterized RDD family membrane protein YckC
MVTIADGRRVTPQAAVLRVLGYIVDGMTFDVGFLMIALRPDRRGLHDPIADIRVVRQ